MRRFEGKTVLVTGASSGIGHAVARRLIQEGACIWGTARDETRLRQASQEWGPGEHSIMAFDASKEESVEAATSEWKRGGVRFDAAVLCVGQDMRRPLQVMKSVHIESVLAANVGATLLCSKAFARCANPQGGALVWLSSAAALAGNPAQSAYSAAKGALISACRALASELGGRRIRVNVIAPGVVPTPMSDTWLKGLSPEQRRAVEQQHLLGFGRPEDVAAAAAFLASDDARWITGTCLTVDGGLTCR